MKRRLAVEGLPQTHLSAAPEDEYDPSKRRPLSNPDDEDDAAPMIANGFHPGRVQDAVLYEQWLINEGPPPAVLISNPKDAGLLWTCLGRAAAHDQIRCMLCRKAMKRSYWTTHMRSQHGGNEGEVRVCPFAYCGWKSTSNKERRRHFLDCHDRLGFHCRQCPDLLFDRRATQWKHQCLTHLNWAPNDFHADIGEDPLDEDDEGGTRLESTADVDCATMFYWESLEDEAPPLQSLSCAPATCASTETRVGGSMLGHCIWGMVPW